LLASRTVPDRRYRQLEHRFVRGRLELEQLHQLVDRRNLHDRDVVLVLVVDCNRSR
jgi:hypothetical protein